MLIAFFGCFRLSNLVPSSQSQFDPLKHLRKEDVSFEDDDTVLIFYKWSKTNQYCKKVTWVPICCVSDSRFDVMLNLKKLFTLCKAPAKAPLFSYDSKLFHTRHSLVKILDLCVSEACLPSTDYSWHSFRRGSAMFAFESGLADTAVQLLGDWSSSAFKHYLEFAFKSKVDVSETIAHNFNSYIKDSKL